jgi:ABC-type transport system involved in multi-copper enzyme maturation permease subunit
MEFIVYLYRWLIFLFFGIILFVVTNIFLWWLQEGSSAASGTAIMFVGIGLLIFSILSTGVIAVFISIHDRHIELVDGVSRLADALETSNYCKQSSDVSSSSSHNEHVL